MAFTHHAHSSEKFVFTNSCRKSVLLKHHACKLFHAFTQEKNVFSRIHAGKKGFTRNHADLWGGASWWSQYLSKKWSRLWVSIWKCNTPAEQEPLLHCSIVLSSYDFFDFFLKSDKTLALHSWLKRAHLLRKIIFISLVSSIKIFPNIKGVIHEI